MLDLPPAHTRRAVALDLVDAKDKVIRSGGRAGLPPGYAAAITACSEAGARVPDIDSVSQGLFSMTLHARAAEKAVSRSPVAAADPAMVMAASDIAALRELTSAALAEVRALIFEIRPDALAEAGLVAALTLQAAAVTARSSIDVTVSGPAERLPVPGPAEEQAGVRFDVKANPLPHQPVPTCPCRPFR